MSLYPLYLDLSAKHVLVVGAGSVGLRKIHSLLDAAPKMLKVVDPALDESTIRDLERKGVSRCEARPFADEDLDGMFLVFAASGCRQTNERIAALCREKDILCNCIDAPNTGSFIVPAHFSLEGICVALSTSGQSPALARHIRKELEGFIGSRYTALLGVLARLRPLLLALGLPTEKNTAIFRELVESPLKDLLVSQDNDAAMQLLRTALPNELHPHLREILHGH